MKEATRLYAASWVRDIGPELRPNEYKKKENSGDESDKATVSTGETEPSTLEDLGKFRKYILQLFSIDMICFERILPSF